jgi:hypothetical protein
VQVPSLYTLLLPAVDYVIQFYTRNHGDALMRSTFALVETRVELHMCTFRTILIDDLCKIPLLAIQS